MLLCPRGDRPVYDVLFKAVMMAPPPTRRSTPFLPDRQPRSVPKATSAKLGYRMRLPDIRNARPSPAGVLTSSNR